MNNKKEINKIKFLINKFPNEITALNRFKSKYSLSELSLYFNEVLSLPKFNNHYINMIDKRTIENLGNVSPFLHNDRDFWKELGWITLILNRYSKKIKVFLELRDLYEQSYLIGDYKKASQLLYKIDEICGESTWSLKNRISLTQAMEGIDAQKKLSTSLRAGKISASLNVIIFFSSIANEKNTSYDYFNTKLEMFFKDSVKEDWYHYYMFLLKRDYYVPFENIPYLLNAISTSSVIDLYEAYRRILIYISSVEIEDDNYGNKKLFSKLLRKFFNNSNANELINYLRVLDVDIRLTTDEMELDNIKIFDYSFTNQVKQQQQEVEKLLLNKPNLISIYSLYVESLTKLNTACIFEKNSLIYEIIENMKNLALRNEKYHSSLNNILKLATANSSLSCMDYLVSEIHSNIADYSHPMKSSKELLIQLPLITKSLYYSKDKREKYIKEIIRISPNSFLPNIFFIILDEHKSEAQISQYIDNNIKDKDINILIKTFYYSYIENNKRVIEECEKIFNSANYSIEHYARDTHLNTLLKYDIKHATKILVDYYLENESLQLSLPISTLCNKIELEINKYGDWPEDIETVILFHIYLKKRILDKKSILEFLYENYLVANKCTTPMEFIIRFRNNPSKFDLKHIYFLKEICVPDIMKKSIYFKETRSKEHERINICHEMLLLDYQNKTIYEDEIKYREKELFLKNEMIRIGKNKIYVNIEGVKETLSKLLNEDFIRFKELSKNSDFKIEEIEIYNYIRSLYIYNKDKQKYESLSDSVPSNEVYELMKNMVELIRDTFVNNEHFGLNVYLSTRIRHGTLKNHLRKPVEENNLISLKRKKTGKYNINQYWEHEFLLESDSISNDIQNYLEIFSKEYDNLIEHISSDLLQVFISNTQSNPKPNGLFVYELTENEMRYLMKELIYPEITFDEFINNVIDFMWEKTDYNLQIIRQYFETNINREYSYIFDELLSKIESIKCQEQQKVKDLRNAIIKGKSDTQRYISNLVLWFNRLQLHDRNDYTINDVIALIEKIIPKIKGNTKIFSLEEIKLKGKTFENFLDIFDNLINNVIKHNEYNTIPIINIRSSKEDEILKIFVSNKVTSKLSIEELNKTIEAQRKTFCEKSSENKLHLEEKTGFIKIRKILRVDLKIDSPIIDFKYIEIDDSIHFMVEIFIDTKDIIV